MLVIRVIFPSYVKSYEIPDMPDEQITYRLCQYCGEPVRVPKRNCSKSHKTLASISRGINTKGKT